MQGLLVSYPCGPRRSSLLLPGMLKAWRAHQAEVRRREEAGEPPFKTIEDFRVEIPDALRDAPEPEPKGKATYWILTARPVPTSKGSGPFCHQRTHRLKYSLLLGHWPFSCQTFTVSLLVVPKVCLLYTSPSPRDKRQSRMPSSA